MMFDIFKAMERVENAVGELEAAGRIIDPLREADILKIDETKPFSEWMPLVTRGKVSEARDATAAALDALEVAQNYLHELHCMQHGDSEL